MVATGFGGGRAWGRAGESDPIIRSNRYPSRRVCFSRRCPKIRRLSAAHRSNATLHEWQHHCRLLQGHREAGARFLASFWLCLAGTTSRSPYIVVSWSRSFVSLRWSADFICINRCGEVWGSGEAKPAAKPQELAVRSTKAGRRLCAYASVGIQTCSRVCRPLFVLGDVGIGMAG